MIMSVLVPIITASQLNYVLLSKLSKGPKQWCGLTSVFVDVLAAQPLLLVAFFVAFKSHIASWCFFACFDPCLRWYCCWSLGTWSSKGLQPRTNSILQNTKRHKMSGMPLFLEPHSILGTILMELELLATRASKKGPKSERQFYRKMDLRPAP